LDSPQKLEIHLETEHQWGVKKDSKNKSDHNTWSATSLDVMLKDMFSIGILDFLGLLVVAHELQFHESRFVKLGFLRRCIVAMIVW